MNDVWLRSFRQKFHVEDFRCVTDGRDFVSIRRMRDELAPGIPHEFFRSEPAHSLNESALDLAARDAGVNHVACIVQNIDASHLRHSAEAVDFNFGNRRADCEIMERSALPRFAIEINLRRLVITRRAQARAIEVRALNQFRETQL